MSESGIEQLVPNISVSQNETVDQLSKESGASPVTNVNPQQKSVDKTCDDMLKKVMEYLHSELTATADDYKLLETLNNMTIAKYQNMSRKTNELTEDLESINEKYNDLKPYLEKIDQLEEGVQKLEAAAYKLDSYSKQLEMKFKKMERK